MRGIPRIWILLFVLAYGLNIPSARCQSAIPEFSAFPGVDTHWVDSVMNSLMPEQRLAQLFMLACFTQKDDDKLSAIPEYICKYNLGGIMFMRSSPVKMAKMCNWYQSLARTPLLIAADAEWGLSMRIDSTVSFPRPMSMGAANDEQLVYDAAAEMARQLKRLGIHMNFAPVVDVNNNPQNPVISNRSFGEDKRLVARLGIAYMKGLQDNGIIATAKHFPGHGDTRSDSHFELPQLNFTRERLDSLELYPFREMIKNGVMGIMNGHLNVPALDATPKRPSSLSPKIVTDLLQKEMQFKGLVVTDALGMKGVVDFYKPGVAEKKAFLAGNDLLLYTENFTIAIDTIMKAVQNGEIKQEEIDRRCRKILAAKYFAGLNHYKPIKLEGLTKDLNAGNAEKIKRKLIESSVTIVKNKNDLIPLKGLDTMCVATVFIGKTDTSAFQDMVSKYCKSDHFFIKSTEKIADVDTLINQLYGYNLVIIAINNTSNKPYRNYGITPQIIYLVDTIAERSHVILDIFGNPYCLYYFPSAKKADAITLSYHTGQSSHEISAQVIFGGLGTKARLPVTASRDFPVHSGVDVQKTSKLEFTFPEEAGMNSKELSRIDSIVSDGIKKGAFPGCQVLVARKGMVVYDKSFGYQRYDKKQKVENSDIYDLASLTKVLSTTLAVMHLYDHNKINIDAKLSEFFPEAKQNDKKSTTLRDIMTHQ
ncbi:MAG: glycoside hydrolase family 3 N-terminal domain-containing protein, partial [Bacteroidota bacterium]